MSGGRCMRSSGTWEEVASLMLVSENFDSETRTAAARIVVSASVSVLASTSKSECATPVRVSSSSEMSRTGRRVRNECSYRKNVPSSSRTYFGPICFFSALHCARIRTRICRSGIPVVVVDIDDAASPLSLSFGEKKSGSHHQPSRSTPSSPLPPTRSNDIERSVRNT